MKVKTTELTGPALDWAVAKCEFPERQAEQLAIWVTPLPCDDPDDFKYQPSTCWSQGGPLIDLGKIDTFNQRNGFAGAIEMATRTNPHPGPYFGPTTLIAICRCYVASKLGDEVDVPEELLCPSPPIRHDISDNEAARSGDYF